MFPRDERFCMISNPQCTCCLFLVACTIRFVCLISTKTFSLCCRTKRTMNYTHMRSSTELHELCLANSSQCTVGACRAYCMHCNCDGPHLISHTGRFNVYEYVQMSQCRRIDDDTCTGTDSFAPVPVVLQAASVCTRQMIAFKCISWHKVPIRINVVSFALLHHLVNSIHTPSHMFSNRHVPSSKSVWHIRIDAMKDEISNV